MNIRQFNKDIKAYDHDPCTRLELFYVGREVGALFPYYIDDLCEFNTEQREKGVYLIVAGPLRVIADEYRVER